MKTTLDHFLCVYKTYMHDGLFRLQLIVQENKTLT